MDKKIIFSGMQPSGYVTLGNYLGAIRNWTNLQDEYNCLFCVVDLHALTTRQVPSELRKRSRDLLIQYIATGLDPEKNIMYYQSHVSGHAELSWILNCYTYIGELERMTQFKDKSKKHNDNVNSGLFTYPVLMAADILLYNTDLVPVGKDQKQHLELARNIAERFNNIYGDVFKVPEPYISPYGAKIMSLQEPDKKMSKSDENENAYICILDSPDLITKKIKRAVTDSLGEINYTENQRGVKNLLDIYSSFCEITPQDALERFVGKGYKELKEETAEVIVEALKPIQNRYNDLQKNKDYIDEIIKKNAELASKISCRTLSKVKKKIGLPI